MNQIGLQGQILSLLENFKGMEPLKTLFWTKLNYDRVNKPTSRRGWPEAAASVIADDPTLLAAGGEKGEFHILYSRLAKDRLSLADERIATSLLLKNHPYGLFVFSDRTQTQWHFINVKYAEETPSRMFRRLTVAPTESLRTASEVIAQLDLDQFGEVSSKLSPLFIQQSLGLSPRLRQTVKTLLTVR